LENRRPLYFLLSILVGVGLGLLIGWVLYPLQFAETTADSLSADYKADYTLMVAEVYQTDNDPGLAAVRLAPLGDQPLRTVQEAIVTGQDLGFARRDMELMAQLLQALQVMQQGGAP